MNPSQVSLGAVGSVLHRVSGNIISAAANGTPPSNLGATSLGQVPSQSSNTNVSGATVQSSPPANNQASNSGPPMSPSVIVQLSQHPHLSAHPSTPRRGRFPGSKNKSPASREVVKSTETPDTQVKRRGRPPGSRNRYSLTASSLRGTRTPSGLRRSAIPDDGLQVRVPSRDSSVAVPSHHNEPTIPGPIGKKSRNQSEQQPPNPPFVIFGCQWKDCPAKLHNLEVLRKHVFKVHGKPSADGTYVCRWEDCGDSQTQENGDTIMVDKAPEPIRRKFDSADSWKAHVESSHIGTLAWTLGDGPTTYPDGRLRLTILLFALRPLLTVQCRYTKHRLSSRLLWPPSHAYNYGITAVRRFTFQIQLHIEQFQAPRQWKRRLYLPLPYHRSY